MALYIANSEEMQTLDRYIMEEFGILPEILMERAGLSVATFIKEVFPPPKRVLVLTGPGNNGGDSLVCARYLWNWDYKIKVVTLAEETKYSQEAKYNLELLKKQNIFLLKVENLNSFKELFKDFKPDLVIDGLFGTGLKRPLEGLLKEIILFLNTEKESTSVKIIAIDLPSGVSSDNGQILGIAIRADFTITFECLKIGHLVYPGKEHCGEVKVFPIGYPWKFLKERKPKIIPQRKYLDKVLAKGFFRPRQGFYHKGKSGYLLVLAGSIGKSGAAYLTALAAVKSGVGLVTLASTKSLQSIYAQLLPEALTLGLPEEEGEIAENSLDILLSNLRGKKCLVIGPGLGLGKGPKKVLFSLLETINLPVVLDADALTHLSENLEILKKFSYPKVITPHPGEAGRLLKKETVDVLKDPLRALRELVEATSGIVVLKGPHTLIGSPEGYVYISSIDEPGMAQGGMGDVLSGLIGSLVAQGYPPLDAAALGVYFSGRAGSFLRETLGPFGFTARDVANNLPKILKEIEN